MTKLEEMAKAGWEQTQLQVPEAYRLMDWGLVPPEAKKNFTEFMVAGLKVLREPSEAMLDAAKDTIETGAVADGWEPRRAWLAMIDTMLAEAPK